jgi:DNA-binding CsgD family transcriptional regulator
MSPYYTEQTPQEDLLRAAAASQLSLALFDHVGSGLLVCDADGLLRFVNHAARQELARGGLLVAVGRQMQRASGASGDLPGALRAAALKGRRSLVRLVRGDERLMAGTVPFSVPGLDQPLVLVTLGRRQACSMLELEMLGASYGLTLAERRVLAALVREAKPKQIADENAVKVSTVRTQISSIRSKLGTRSVEGLLLRAAEMPPMAAAA